MLKALLICCWILSCVAHQIPNVTNKEVASCELVEKAHGELKVFGKKTDVPPNEDKCWQIDLKDPSREVVLVFNNFNLLDSDQLTILGSDRNSTPSFGPFRGQRGVFSLFTGLSSVVVHLKTSNQKPWDRHFMAKYYTNECKYEETVNDRGTFASPLYGRGRSKPVECTYTFIFVGSTSKLQKLVLSFLEVNLTEGSTVQVEGSEATDGTYQGDKMPNKLLSSSRLQLKLHIDPTPSQEFQQFQAHYELATASCSEVVVSNDSDMTFGVPSSLIPSEKNGVPASAQCHWILRSPIGTRVGARFLTNMAQMGSHDSLTVGGPSLESHLFAPGGKNLSISGSSFQSASNELWVIFTSPSIQPGTALRMQSMANGTQGGYLRNSGNFTVSPESNSVGVLMLEVRSDQRVHLFLPKSRSTALELRSNFDRSSVPFLRLLPSIPLESVISPSSRLMIVVESRFQASFDGVDGACHKVVRPGERSGLYTAPRYCGNYTFLLPPRSDPKELVELRLLALDLRPGDLVTLHRLDDDLSVVATFKWDEKVDPPPIHNPSEAGLLLKVIPDQGGSGDGTVLQFSYVFKKGCIGRYELKSGQSVDLRSPLFPDRYPLGSQCQWDLHWRGPLLIRSHRVQLAHPSHRLTLGGGADLSSPSWNHPSTSGQLSLSTPPPDGTTKVMFSAVSGMRGEDDAGSGFWITATALDCGEIVREHKRKWTIPAGSLTCVWVVNATVVGMSSVVTSIFFRTTFTSRHLSVYENMDGAPKLELVAGRELQIQGGSAFVVYNRSTSSDADRLLEITYGTEECSVSSICGGNKCMKASWRCNGINECGDYADEANCSVTGHLPSVPVPASPVYVTGTEGGKSTHSSVTPNDSSTPSGPLAQRAEAGLSWTYVSLCIVVAVIVGATIPSSVYFCLLKRESGRCKTDSRWTMIMNGKNLENADGISL